ncbi:hypothetical protein B0H13DRAFT_1899997 [Mycena leptocephala]|nr:hypothetical protein B0H13DRAFT_1899997 [Mycena leptocephala]
MASVWVLGDRLSSVARPVTQSLSGQSGMIVLEGHHHGGVELLELVHQVPGVIDEVADLDSQKKWRMGEAGSPWRTSAWESTGSGVGGAGVEYSIGSNGVPVRDFFSVRRVWGLFETAGRPGRSGEDGVVSSGGLGRTKPAVWGGELPGGFWW